MRGFSRRSNLAVACCLAVLWAVLAQTTATARRHSAIPSVTHGVYSVPDAVIPEHNLVTLPTALTYPFPPLHSLPAGHSDPHRLTGNILSITHDYYSHMSTINAISLEMAKRGYNVTVLIPETRDVLMESLFGNVSNVHPILHKGCYLTRMDAGAHWINRVEMNVVFFQEQMACSMDFYYPVVERLAMDPATRPDVIFCEWLSVACPYVARLFGIPYQVVTTIGERMTFSRENTRFPSDALVDFPFVEALRREWDMPVFPSQSAGGGGGVGGVPVTRGNALRGYAETLLRRYRSPTFRLQFMWGLILTDVCSILLTNMGLLEPLFNLQRNQRPVINFQPLGNNVPLANFPLGVRSGPQLVGPVRGEEGPNYWGLTDHTLRWLEMDDQRPVLLISFGTLVTFNKNMLRTFIRFATQYSPYIRTLWAFRFVEANQEVFAEAGFHVPWLLQSSAGGASVSAEILHHGFDNVTSGTHGMNDTQLGRALHLDSSIRVIHWVSQKGALAHPHVRLFYSHCGGRGSFEGMILGTPTLCTGFVVDQPDMAADFYFSGFGDRILLDQLEWRPEQCGMHASNRSVLRDTLPSQEVLRSHYSELNPAASDDEVEAHYLDHLRSFLQYEPTVRSDPFRVPPCAAGAPPPLTIASKVLRMLVSPEVTGVLDSCEEPSTELPDACRAVGIWSDQCLVAIGQAYQRPDSHSPPHVLAMPFPGERPHFLASHFDLHKLGHRDPKHGGLAAHWNPESLGYYEQFWQALFAVQGDQDSFQHVFRPDGPGVARWLREKRPFALHATLNPPSCSPQNVAALKTRAQNAVALRAQAHCVLSGSMAGQMDVLEKFVYVDSKMYVHATSMMEVSAVAQGLDAAVLRAIVLTAVCFVALWLLNKCHACCRGLRSSSDSSSAKR